MRVGMTYDLRSDYLAAGYGEEETAEFDSPETIQGIENAVRAMGHEPDRIGNARHLTARLAQGDRWDLVFNIAEGLRGIGREAQVPAMLDVYDIPYTFSDPLVLAVCLHKGLTKLIVRAAGVPTPDFAVVERPNDVARIDLPYPLFAKPVAEGTGKGISPSSKISGRAELQTTCERLLEEFRQPVLVETYLPGREFTVGLLGCGPESRVIGGMEVHFASHEADEIYSFTTKRDYEDLVHYTPMSGEAAERMSRIALTAWQALGCRDGGRVDFRMAADGTPHFLEVNPLPGLNPTHSDLPILARMAGLDYNGLLAEIVASARKRLKI